jgi:hypothetical protein
VGPAHVRVVVVHVDDPAAAEGFEGLAGSFGLGEFRHPSRLDASAEGDR